MAQETKVVRKPRVVKEAPSADQAHELQSQVDLLLRADSALSSIITSDINMGEFESPFIHPLYQVRIKLDAMRGKKAKRLAAYARSMRKNGVVKRVA